MRTYIVLAIRKSNWRKWRIVHFQIPSDDFERSKKFYNDSRDSSCRPHELLKLRTKDVVFKTSGDYQYAEITVNGKTGTRTIPLFACIPYLKDWLDEHPQRDNTNAMLFPSMSDRNFGRKMMGRDGNTTFFGDEAINFAWPVN